MTLFKKALPEQPREKNKNPVFVGEFSTIIGFFVEKFFEKAA